VTKGTPGKQVMVYQRIWWLKQILLSGVAIFFTIFGVQVLLAAYQLEDPFFFVMTFFASNFIILISVALLIGFIYRMRSALRPITPENEEEEQHTPKAQ
jgi:hypothetical protein